MQALVLGRRRQGKSTVALAIAASQNNTTIIFDPNAQFCGFPTTSSVAEVERFLSATIESHARNVVVFRPQPGLTAEDFTALTDMLWGWDDFSLIIDEAAALQKPAYLHPNLERLVRQAPAGVVVIQTTHRIVDIHRLCRMLASDVWFFYVRQNDADLKTVQAEYCAEVAELIPYLRRYECLHYWLADGGAQRYAVWDDPKAWYVDLDNSNQEKTEKVTA